MKNKIFKQIVILLITFSYNSISYSQVSIDMMKYWYYRNRLKYFVVPGEKWGESQIICVRNLIDAPNDPNQSNNPDQWTNIDYGQIGKYTGLYIGTLATEYYLLKNNGQYEDAAHTAYELYLALYAYQEYWDAKAENYWSGWTSNNSNYTDPLNGFFIRGNVPCDFLDETNLS
ncbi:MAG TPA: hypothetical protein PKK00_14495 [Bacteroidales bacterium]|nr:hypothetical protein [Bacteroidales bacterium]HPS18409.1 hypothetical protein [Bacteroidales bacterium]